MFCAVLDARKHNRDRTNFDRSLKSFDLRCNCQEFSEQDVEHQAVDLLHDKNIDQRQADLPTITRILPIPGRS